MALAYGALFVLTMALLGAASAFAADDRSYDDPGMHFAPPAGWQKLPVPPQTTSGEAGDAPPAAVFAYDIGKADQRLIVVDIQPFSGRLDAYASSHESKLHQSGDGVFVKGKKQVTLSNGMPAYFMQADSGNEAGKFQTRFDYVVIDGQRGIVVSYLGRQGDFDEKTATSALSTLYVVAYPGARR